MPFKLQLRKAKFQRHKTDFAKKSLLNTLRMSIYIKILFLCKDQEDLSTGRAQGPQPHTRTCHRVGWESGITCVHMSARWSALLSQRINTPAGGAAGLNGKEAELCSLVGRVGVRGDRGRHGTWVGSPSHFGVLMVMSNRQSGKLFLQKKLQGCDNIPIYTGSNASLPRCTTVTYCLF